MQHGGGLTGDKPRDHHDVAAREFERVMMDVRIVHIELPEPGNLVLHARLPEQTESTVIFDLLLEGEFGAGKQTDGDVGFPDGSEAAGDRFREFRHHQLVTNLGRPRSDEMKTVIAHGALLSRGTADTALRQSESSPTRNIPYCGNSEALIGAPDFSEREVERGRLGNLLRDR